MKKNRYASCALSIRNDLSSANLEHAVLVFYAYFVICLSHKHFLDLFLQEAHDVGALRVWLLRGGF